MTDGVFSGTGDHGTAVFGIIAASGVGPPYGVKGIAPGAKFGVASVPGPSGQNLPADAINVAASHLAPNDVILIEVNERGPSSGLMGDPNCNPAQFGMIAMEYWQADFDAIQLATSRGIHVVEAAGNGAVNLDHAIYERRFDRTLRDSGAIMVGARGQTRSVPNLLQQLRESPRCRCPGGAGLDHGVWHREGSGAQATPVNGTRKTLAGLPAPRPSSREPSRP